MKLIDFYISHCAWCFVSYRSIQPNILTQIRKRERVGERSLKQRYSSVECYNGHDFPTDFTTFERWSHWSFQEVDAGIYLVIFHGNYPAFAFGLYNEIFLSTTHLTCFTHLSYILCALQESCSSFSKGANKIKGAKHNKHMVPKLDEIEVWKYVQMM